MKEELPSSHHIRNTFVLGAVGVLAYGAGWNNVDAPAMLREAGNSIGKQWEELGKQWDYAGKQWQELGNMRENNATESGLAIMIGTTATQCTESIDGGVTRVTVDLNNPEPIIVYVRVADNGGPTPDVIATCIENITRDNVTVHLEQQQPQRNANKFLLGPGSQILHAKW